MERLVRLSLLLTAWLYCSVGMMVAPRTPPASLPPRQTLAAAAEPDLLRGREAEPLRVPPLEREEVRVSESSRTVPPSSTPVAFADQPLAAGSPPVVTALTSRLPAPQRVQIPSLGVDAPVLPVSLDDDGALALTDDAAVVFWYQESGYPGRPGRVVLAGHVDAPGGRPGIFAALHRLAAGERVIVEREDGIQVHYVVTERVQVDATTLPPDLVGFRHPPELVLVTCAGSWIPQEQRYTHNWLVFAVAAPQPGELPAFEGAVRAPAVEDHEAHTAAAGGAGR